MNPSFHSPTKPLALACAALLGLAGGAPALAQSSNSANSAPPARARLAAEPAATLQACSYDGSPVSFSPPDLSKGGSSGREVVAEIMKYTGLPANFVVVEGQVPNAAAIIMLDDRKVPRRVIAYNSSFMGEVIRATRANNWAPVSIMAHEIGHHLSGHTIVPGGSQPPIELESDKFSGFVLYKMGAPLKDAQNAIATLVPEQDGATHPGRRKRLSAIADGWTQACELQGGGAQCQGGKPVKVAVAAPAPAPAAAPQRPVKTAQAPAPAPAPTAAPSAALGAAPAQADTLPGPDPQALPSKGTQFIYDEFGVLDPTIRARFERQMFEHARDKGVEIVTLLVKDLHGLSAEQYAWAMLRQLRVGKLDVGNGAVLVVAPQQGQAGVALGAGVQLEMAHQDKARQLKSWIDVGWKECQRKNACGNWTENLLGAADHVRRDTRHWDWTVSYPSLSDIQQAAAAEGGKNVAPQQSKVWRRITRLSGTVEALDPRNKWVIDAKLDGDKRHAVQVRTDDGLTAMLYVDRQVEALQPGGALQPGKRYAFIARESGLSHNPNDAQTLDLLSFALAQ
ncbi:hypothetical protein C6568_12590 [Melaminivora suipulveris]|uniref:TPM domain-containing protein n=1 Tax=Melaminivora suipulveris TaxID=2109913 RepID=A0A2R3QEB4_9BURK|nr:TPM domain-containing protein [Melaminivora suipulveris]AVO49997.1 hypothetical protein C6568_12590 [Melaminivora suipulveris]